MNEIEKSKEKLVTRSFLLAFETLFIFGIPAIVGTLLGKWIKTTLETGSWVVYLTLAVMFVLSWTIFLIRVKAVSKKIEKLKQESLT